MSIAAGNKKLIISYLCLPLPSVVLMALVNSVNSGSGLIIGLGFQYQKLPKTFLVVFLVI